MKVVSPHYYLQMSRQLNLFWKPFLFSAERIASVFTWLASVEINSRSPIIMVLIIFMIYINCNFIMIYIISFYLPSTLLLYPLLFYSSCLNYFVLFHEDLPFSCQRKWRLQVNKKWSIWKYVTSRLLVDPFVSFRRFL